MIGSVCLTALLTPFFAGIGESTGPAATAPAAEHRGRSARLARGVVINWPKGQVEIDAEVVLREGVLELLACAPGTKEHESILRVRARPFDVYKALGLLGLPDGNPPYFEAETQRVVPPRGTPVDCVVRYERDGREHEHDALEWLQPRDGSRDLRGAGWYYVGSAPPPGARFGADVYGTVVTVVPFGSALVLLAREGEIEPPGAATTRPGSARELDDAAHDSAGDEWTLTPRGPRIPPERTPVTLILRPRAPRVRAWIDRFGRIRLGSRTVTADDLAAAVHQSRASRPNAGVTLSMDALALPSDVERTVARLLAAGIPAAELEREWIDADSLPPHDASAAAELLVHQFELHRSLWNDAAVLFRAAADRLEARRRALEEWQSQFKGLLHGGGSDAARRRNRS